MAERPPSSQDAAALLDSLRTLRGQLLSSTREERLRLLAARIDREVAGLPADTRRRLLERLRETLQPSTPATTGDGATVRLLAEHAAEKARLQERLERETRRANELEKQLEQLKQQQSRRPVPVAGGGFERLREGLSQHSQGRDASADSLGLAGPDAGLYDVIRELTRFALDFEMVAINPLLMELEVGPLKSADTQMFHSFQRQVGDRFRACLEMSEGALGKLKETLNKNAKFLLFLNYSYLESIDKGTRAVLERIDPSTILERHKRMIGYDYDGAWQKLTSLHDELRTRPKRDIWDEFYQAPFRAKLSSYMDAGK